MATKDLIFTHNFTAPVERVWRAWTDPELVKQWWGPDGFSCLLAKIDFREGGTSLLAMHAPAELHIPDSYSTWTYTKIIPNHRIEYTHNLSDPDGNKIDPTTMGMPADFPQEQRHVLELEDLGDGQTRLLLRNIAGPTVRCRSSRAWAWNSASARCRSFWNKQHSA